MKTAGFYIHIPFCRQACRYCDFHFSVSLRFKPELVNALVKEIESRRNEYEQYEFTTLYFGGGTPSVLDKKELARITGAVFKNYNFRKDIEFTFEANPDDLNIAYLKDLKAFGVNRLSIGIQSFRDEDLRLMRRSHDARQAREAVMNSYDLGLKNINIDLIYGIPGMSTNAWAENLEQAFILEIPHISAYHLTFETGTVFDHWRKKGRIYPVEDEVSLEQFRLLRKMTENKNYQHYEISNFARENFFSQHNTGYWKQVPYIGTGPSAHSYLNNRRRWNISSNKRYLESLLKNDDKYYEYEELSTIDLYNEYVLTSLRTMWGMDLDEISRRFGDNYVKYTQQNAQKFLQGGELIKEDKIIRLSGKGIFLADYIIREFFS